MIMKPNKITLVAAVAANGVIGNSKARNGLAFDMPAERAAFRELIRGKTVIVGHNTYKLMGRSLDNSKIALLHDYNIDAPDDSRIIKSGGSICDLFYSMKYEQHVDCGEVFIIGGAYVYEMALNQGDLVDSMIITHVHACVEGDVFFPPVDFVEWACDTEFAPHGVSGGYRYTTATYGRNN